MRRLLRVARAVGVGVVALLLVTVAVVCAQQRLLRWRAERLLADFQSVRLNQSDWAEMQRLMTRWGAWGRYEGTCTAKDCIYHVHVQDSVSRITLPVGDRTLRLLTADWMRRIYERLGGRIAWMDVWVRVQDGTIRRKSIDVVTGIPPGSTEPGVSESALVVRAVSRPFLQSWVSNVEPGHNSPMSEERIVNHPDYEVRRPSGCLSCLMGIVVFTPQLPDAELRRLTAFDLSCLTRWRACEWLEQLDPAAKDWDLYAAPWSSISEESIEADSDAIEKHLTEPCRLPVWARARDASSILTADAVSSRVRPLQDGEFTETKLRVVSVLKGKTSWKEGEMLSALRFSGRGTPGPEVEQGMRGEPMVVGRRYVLTPDSAEDGDKKISLMRCSVMDTDERTMRDVAKGVTLGDPLRGGEKWPGMDSWWMIE